MNKEIEQLLNNFKNEECYYVGTNGCLYQDLTKKEINLLLSHIEQLQQENKNLTELDENYPIEEQLEEALKYQSIYKKRIDKAIEYIEENKEFSEYLKIIDLLKGE